jgi:hypothetical protein
MNFTETSPNLQRNSEILTPKNKDNRVWFTKHFKTLTESEKELLKNEIQEFYFIKGWGLKIVARNVLGISYSNCRSIFGFLGLEFNKGYNVCNDFLRNFRKEKADVENKTNVGFNNAAIQRFAKTTSRGVQGYYYNKSTSSYVWLRSTYEYIYAKFLNKIGVNWKTEQKYYILSDGSKYSPDFYVYDENWVLEKIIEIKGYYDCRAYKVDLLREEFFKESNIDVILIRDIDLYLENNLTYGKELETWKTIRKSKEFLLKV